MCIVDMVATSHNRDGGELRIAFMADFADANYKKAHVHDGLWWVGKTLLHFQAQKKRGACMWHMWCRRARARAE